jgi:hypothetical protein
MIAQTVLPFKLEITDDEITAHAGLAVFGEFLRALDVPGLLDRALPGPGSGAGYAASAHVLPLLLMLHGGGRSLEDLRQIREDLGLRELLGLSEIPSADAVGDWLRRMGAGRGLSDLAEVNRRFLRRALKPEERADYTLDLDAMQIVAEKREARWTYKGERGYMPLVGHLAENGLVVGHEFREGNAAPQAGNREFIEACAAEMPRGKRIARVRSDSAGYQAAIFNWCEDHDATFAIGADLDAAVVAAIGSIPAGAWRPYQDGWIAQTVHSMNETKTAFRLVVVRRPAQGKLFGEEGPHERYKAIASNRDETAEETVAWYNQRGEASENRIKELKIGFGMERMPCGEFGANAAFFGIGVLAYNLFVVFKRDVLPADWRRRQVQTLRWRLYQVAGKVVHHAGALVLKVRRSALALLEAIRARSLELARA